MIVARSKLPATGAIGKFVDEVGTGVTEDEEKGSFDYAVALNRWSMRLLGLWPLDTRLSHLRCGMSLGMSLVITLPAIARLFVLTDLVGIMYQANLTLPLLPTFVRFVVMKVEAKNLRTVLHSMSRDWASYRYLPARDRRSMFHYVKKGRRINAVCIAWMTLTIGGEANPNVSSNSGESLPRKPKNQNFILFHYSITSLISLIYYIIFHRY